MNFRIAFLSISALSMVALFQNCGKMDFSSQSPTLTTASNKLSVDAPIANTSGSDIVTSNEGGDSNSNSSDSGNTQGSGEGNQSNAQGGSCHSSSDLVECDLNGASQKVIFASGSISSGSNQSSTRVCMSQNACLNLVNAYAAVRGCSLSIGAPSTSASGSCASIFPGSKGTCKNAKVIADGEIANILADMSKRK